jgi:uncharacterized protein (DUF1778 family)
MTDKETPPVIDFAARAKAREESKTTKPAEAQGQKEEKDFTADDALEAAKGLFKKVLIIGLDEDDETKTISGGDLTVETCVYLCELTKTNTMLQVIAKYPG